MHLGYSRADVVEGHKKGIEVVDADWQVLLGLAAAPTCS
jgi:hypothetical protein